MKKLISMLLALILLVSLIGCSDDIIDTNTDTDTEQISTDTEALDTSIKISGEEKERREETENQYRSEIFRTEDGYYPVMSCGKYLGDDFKNIAYYGDYYRIIDNYEDICTLTALGYTLDEELFNDNSVLVIHRYENYLFNYGTKYYALSETDHSLYTNVHLYIWEKQYNIEQEIVPTEVRQTIYLLIPNAEIPNDINFNGEIFIGTMKAE